MRESGRVRDVGGQGGDHADPSYAHRRLRRRERLRALRRAIGYIAFGTGVVVAVAGVVIWAVERDGFPTIGLGMWWALQTVTTVGYGDVVPRTDVGRVVASVIMLTGVAFVAILTATVVSQQARRTAEEEGEAARRELETVLRRVEERLERIEARLGS